MIIGIGGVSQSGKSHLADQLSLRLKNTRVISLDDFAFPTEQLPKVKDRYDWEVPMAYDFDRLLKEIDLAIPQSDHVIAEGILIFYDPRINERFDKRIFLTINKPVFLARRKKETRWGNEPDWFLEHVWKCYEQYGRSVNEPALTLANERFDHQEVIMTYLK